MSQIWSRLPVWADWIIALAAAIVLLNLNVTTAGDPLSSAGADGISELAKTVFYSSMMLAGLIICALGLTIAAMAVPDEKRGRLLATTFAWVALAGVAGLLLDYRDGPVRTVQLAVYIAVVLAGVRLARLIGGDNDVSGAAR